MSDNEATASGRRLSMPAAHARFRLRLYRGEDIAIGPGKIALLQAIGQTGSLSAAARDLGMSYRRAWQLVDEMNRALREPAVTSATGGAQGGGSRLTAMGEQVIAHYQAIEASAAQAAAEPIAALTALLAPVDDADGG